MMTETVVQVQDSSPHSNNAAKPNEQNGQANQQQSPLGWVKLNVDYFKTLPGMLKIAEALLAIICLAFGSPAYLGGTHFFLFVVSTSLIATIIWIFVYFLGVREALNLPINWMLTELLNTAIVAGLYLLGSLIQLIAWSPYYGHPKGVNITAGIFGLFNTLAYALGAYLLYIEWKNNNRVGQ
ncbi:uncharacterized protein LOC123296948 [Chrysoperla carnea]|uniref:uncharacterized protein LOC123296948 n=1 Tax=Chrysoperla carnea TaxID=189513 RepID=UPI001D05DD39|nr:uncharacterized protein LOC123296948 [Chrysoperla carnea]